MNGDSDVTEHEQIPAVAEHHLPDRVGALDEHGIAVHGTPISSVPSSSDPAATVLTTDGRDRVGGRTDPKPSARTRRAASTCHAGYRTALPAERAAFWVLSSFATTVAASRAINYVRERRRSLPRTRGAARVLAELSDRNSVRVHHFLPGIGLGFAAGGVGLMTNPGPLARWLSVPFGTGVALTTDELRLLAGRNNPYWGSQAFALTQSAGAAIGATGLIAQFYRRGRHATAPG